MKTVQISVLLVLVTRTTTLNLKNHGIWDNFYVSSIAVFRNRAFLALPRSSCFNNLTNPTLIEVHWNGDHQNLIAGRKLYFPSEKYQNWGKCEQLQDVISLDVEIKKGRLWVLDKGSKTCPPKIVIYNLYSNSEIHTCIFEELLGEDLSFLVVDSLGFYGSVAYVGNSAGSKLVVFSFTERRWWTVKLKSDEAELQILPERLALSQIEPVLYLTSDKSTELFSLNLTDIRNLDFVKSQKIVRELQVKFLGNKLGPSGGITTDLGNGLDYYLTRDYAILRWFTSEPLKAEHHALLAQSYEMLPYVSHLFNDPHNNVWALVNPLRPRVCDNPSKRKLPVSQEEIPILKSRIVKLIKVVKKRRGGKLVFVTKSK